jgi:enoyl-CoA hydratase
MIDGEVRLVRDGAVATILFDRPQARNAMTWPMYEGLAAACEQLSGDAGVRMAVLRGVGGKAFIAGTDIAQFQEFTTAEQGVDYEVKMESYLTALETLPFPTLAVVEGWAIGGGLAIAACCDLRIATAGTKFGVPIARTLGNCLSIANYARLGSGPV